jgi:hypothetical protein
MKGDQRDRVSDFARSYRPDRDRDMGGSFMSAEIIRSAPCTIPTLEALPHYPLPLGYFVGWCGLNGKILLRIGLGTEIYDGGMKASPLTFPLRSTLECGNDGQKLAFVDEEARLASEVDTRRS